MADSTSNLDLLSSSQASKEISANSLFDSMSANALFGRRAPTTSGLTFGYYGGKFQKPDGTLISIANGALALTGSATNYLYVDSAGAVQKATVAPAGWPAPLASDANALYEIVVGSSSVTSYTDYRAPLRGPTGAAGATGATGPTGPAGADGADGAVGQGVPTGGTAGQQLKKVSSTHYDTAWVDDVFPIVLSYTASPTASQIMLKMTMTNAISIPSNLAGSKATAADVAATGSTTFDIKKNGSSVATLVYAAAGTTPTLATSGGAAHSFAVDDVLSIHAPASADATLSGIYFVLLATRTT